MPVTVLCGAPRLFYRQQPENRRLIRAVAGDRVVVRAYHFAPWNSNLAAGRELAPTLPLKKLTGPGWADEA
jgi:hypothetical protein